MTWWSVARAASGNGLWAQAQSSIVRTAGSSILFRTAGREGKSSAAAVSRRFWSLAQWPRAHRNYPRAHPRRRRRALQRRRVLKGRAGRRLPPHRRPPLGRRSPRGRDPPAVRRDLAVLRRNPVASRPLRRSRSPLPSRFPVRFRSPSPVRFLLNLRFPPRQLRQGRRRIRPQHRRPGHPRFRPGRIPAVLRYRGDSLLRVVRRIRGNHPFPAPPPSPLPSRPPGRCRWAEVPGRWTPSRPRPSPLPRISRRRSSAATPSSDASHAVRTRRTGSAASY